MSGDGITCTSEDGRAVKFANRFTAGASMQKELDVRVSVRGQECVHFVRKASTRDFTVTSALGTISVSTADGTTTAICPDGVRARFTEEDALSWYPLGEPRSSARVS